jgi:putrescine transport system substrate-binding protein
MPRKFAKLLAVCLACTATAVASAEEPVVNVYNWSDYIAEDTLQQFEAATGIKVVYDVYDANEVLEAKLLAGASGYDVIFPSAQPFAERHISAGLYRSLERDKLPHYGNLDPDILGDEAPLDSWRLIFDPAIAKRLAGCGISVLDDEQEALAATPLLDEEMRDDPGIYPPAAVKARLVTAKVMPQQLQRLRVRTWTRIKTGQ